MDKQQEQMNQNSNQGVEYISGFLNEDEEVNESEFDESVGEQGIDKLAEDKQNKPEEEIQLKKSKRPKKTIEQEIAELDAKRERLMEKKRKQDAHEKIVFGAIVMALLKEIKEKSYDDYNNICNRILNFTKINYSKENEIIYNIIKKI